jgi:hypothetical protein
MAFRLRISNSGPEAKPTDAPAFLGPFASLYRRSASNTLYTAPLLSAVSAVQSNPVVPGTSALVVTQLPQDAPPDGYKWSLFAQFTGLPRYVIADAGTTRLDMQLQYEAAGQVWTPLDLSGAGTYSKAFTAPSGGGTLTYDDTVALMALRDLADFSLDVATEASVRCAWGIVQGTQTDTVTFQSTPTAIGSDTIEDVRNGWDFHLRWLLRPSTDIQ